MQICVRANWIIIPLITVAVMLLGQWAMRGEWLWYFSLNLPPINPPAWVFGSAWTVIYILTTAAALIVFNFFEHTTRWYLILFMFAGNAMLNVGWSYVFFKYHMLGLSALWCAMVALTALILSSLIKPISKITALLLVPYVLWATFASLIAVRTWWLNG